MVLPAGAYLVAARARAIPAFSRQTKLACDVCHYGFPALTPFGRAFKLNGYTLTGLQTITAGDTSHTTLKLAPIPPAAAMVIASMTHTSSAQPGTQNNTTAFPDQLSLFLAGQVTPKLGAFIQFTYEGASAQFGIDNTEFRFADRTTFASKSLLYGVTLHNNPTMQDVWNSTPAWGFPFTSSGVAPAPTADVLIDGALGQQVLGLGAYGLWDGKVYGEFTAYRSAPQGVEGPLGADATGVADNVIPYWRVALQHDFGFGYAMLGTYGMVARLFPEGVTGPTSKYTDVAVDGQFEHRLGPFGAVVVRSTYIHERQDLSALVDAGGAANARNTLHTFRLNASYMPSTSFNATLGYFNTGGTRDTVLYAPGEVAGSATGSPASDGAIGEVDFNAWENVRLGAQYVAYHKFNGGTTSYDGAGRNASANDTLFLFVWLAF